MNRSVLGIIIGLLCLSANAQAQNDGALDIATSYVEAYSRLDVDTMEALASEHISFADETAPGAPARRDGRDAVMEGFRALSERGAFDLGFSPEHAFESNNVAVFVGPMAAQFRLADNRIYHWEALVVMTIRIEEGQIIEHRDFADYRGAQEFIEPATNQ